MRRKEQKDLESLVTHAANSLPPSSESPIPLLPPHTLSCGEVIGRGGFATVYEGIYHGTLPVPPLPDQLALKVFDLNKLHIQFSENKDLTATLIDLIIRNTFLCARPEIASHPAMLAPLAYQFNEEEATLSVAFRREKANLRQYFKLFDRGFPGEYEKRGRMVLDAFTSLTSSLSWLHENARITHRDLKPENLFVHYDEESLEFRDLIIGDLDMAGIIEKRKSVDRKTHGPTSRLEDLNTIFGSEPYMPDTLFYQNISFKDLRAPRWDLISVGRMLADLGFGANLTHGGNVYTEAQSRSQFRRSKDLQKIAEKMGYPSLAYVLIRSTDERRKSENGEYVTYSYPTAREFHEDLVNTGKRGKESFVKSRLENRESWSKRSTVFETRYTRRKRQELQRKIWRRAAGGVAITAALYLSGSFIFEKMAYMRSLPYLEGQIARSDFSPGSLDRVVEKITDQFMEEMETVYGPKLISKEANIFPFGCFEEGSYFFGGTNNGSGSFLQKIHLISHLLSQQSDPSTVLDDKINRMLDYYGDFSQHQKMNLDYALANDSNSNAVGRFIAGIQLSADKSILSRIEDEETAQEISYNIDLAHIAGVLALQQYDGDTEGFVRPATVNNAEKGYTEEFRSLDEYFFVPFLCALHESDRFDAILAGDVDEFTSNQYSQLPQEQQDHLNGIVQKIEQLSMKKKAAEEYYRLLVDSAHTNFRYLVGEGGRTFYQALSGDDWETFDHQMSESKEPGYWGPSEKYPTPSQQQAGIIYGFASRIQTLEKAFLLEGEKTKTRLLQTMDLEEYEEFNAEMLEEIEQLYGMKGKLVEYYLRHTDQETLLPPTYFALPNSIEVKKDYIVPNMLAAHYFARSLQIVDEGKLLSHIDPGVLPSDFSPAMNSLEEIFTRTIHDSGHFRGKDSSSKEFGYVTSSSAFSRYYWRGTVTEGDVLHLKILAQQRK